MRPMPDGQSEHAPVVTPKIPRNRGLGVGRPRVYEDPALRRRERHREYMKVYRAKMKEMEA